MKVSKCPCCGKDIEVLVKTKVLAVVKFDGYSSDEKKANFSQQNHSLKDGNENISNCSENI